MTPDQYRIARQAAGSAITRLWDSLVPLRSVNSFMQTGAHPDDETTRLLARLSKGDGVRVAYACCVRGEGGQNNIGGEFRTALGVLRSREMEAAAQVLDMELYWLNEDYDGAIFDFGFSKSAEETFEQWGREHTVERLVRAIRACRPDVIAPTFLDVPGQHGHHRANTVATIEAFRRAGDPEAYLQHRRIGLNPWQPKKLYLPAWSGAGGSYDDEAPPPNATLSIDVGAFDPVHGATYAQIAQWSRACHRSQGMGKWSDPGPDSVPLHRLDCVLDLPLEEDGLFAGLPQTVGDLAGLASESVVGAALQSTQSAIDAAFDAFPDNRRVAEAVHLALASLRRARASLDALSPELRDDFAHRLAVKERQLSHASVRACLLVCTLAFEADEVVVRAAMGATLSIYNGGPIALQRVTLDLDTAEGWRAQGHRPGPAALAGGTRLAATFDVTADPTAAMFHPYRFGGDAHAGAPVIGRVGYVADDVRVEAAVPAEDVLALLPAVSFAAVPDRVFLNLNEAHRGVEINVKAVSHTANPVTQPVRLELPAGWQSKPETRDLVLDGRNTVAAANFAVDAHATLGPGRAVLRVRVGEGDVGLRVEPIAHPHIRRTYRILPAEIQVQAIDVVLPPVRVGYIGAGADRVDHWLRQLGVAVDSLDSDMLATGDLGAYDTILVGVFAFGMRPDLLAARPRVHAYVEAGGNLLTLYHRPWDNWDPEGTPPRYLKVGQPSLRWRVTDPQAEVTVLAPDHPLLHTPNEIGAQDWDGWVKERGLYFAAEWADDYVPLLSMADAAEDELEGALLAADVGRGRHVHAALNLHYQLEFLVPGAVRLLANLIAPRN